MSILYPCSLSTPHAKRQSPQVNASPSSESWGDKVDHESSPVGSQGHKRNEKNPGVRSAHIQFLCHTRGPNPYMIILDHLTSLRLKKSKYRQRFIGSDKSCPISLTFRRSVLICLTMAVSMEEHGPVTCGRRMMTQQTPKVSRSPSTERMDWTC